MFTSTQIYQHVVSFENSYKPLLMFNLIKNYMFILIKKTSWKMYNFEIILVYDIEKRQSSCFASHPFCCESFFASRKQSKRKSDGRWDIWWTLFSLGKMKAFP